MESYTRKGKGTIRNLIQPNDSLAWKQSYPTMQVTKSILINVAYMLKNNNNAILIQDVHIYIYICLYVYICIYYISADGSA